MDVADGGVEGGLLVEPGHRPLGLRGRGHDVLLGRLLVEHVAVGVDGRRVLGLPLAEQVEPVEIWKVKVSKDL